MPTLLDMEMSAACEVVGLREIKRVEACGVPMSAIAKLGQFQDQFGVARIVNTTKNLFEPDPEGRLAMIMPVIAPNVDFGETGIVDLIAFHTCCPAQLLRRTGDGWALGIELLDQDLPVRVVSNPLAWLALAGEAMLILDWDAPRSFWNAIRRGPGLIVESDSIRRRLLRKMDRSVAFPHIEVPLDA